MGLLTDPSAGQSKIVKVLIKYYSKLCVLLYVAGVVYFCALAFREFNGGTYFSENALLPGLVRSEFRDEHSARLFHDELLDEMKKYDDSIPYPWILAKFRQIGLDAYTHNFTLNYPLGKSQTYTGRNVYGILRAARASSTESLVLSMPYRPPTSIHQTTSASLAIMLAFAKFANKEKYWAKDIIFLVTEHEQLGMQAWLEAYHGVSCGKKGTLQSGDLRGRAGAIQAAINLEIHSITIGQIDVKIEGLNGQLPNLDLVNLAGRICIKEGVPHTFKNKFAKKLPNPLQDWKYAFEILMAMVTTQATGVPNGNHGLFYRFGIQAVTIEGFPSQTREKFSFIVMGRILEGVFRSLNNLLERFHQSFFFYLLSSSDRYISIGLYMPAISALAATLFIKGYAKWCQLHEDTTSEGEDDGPHDGKTDKTDGGGGHDDVDDDEEEEEEEAKGLSKRRKKEVIALTPSEWLEKFEMEDMLELDSKGISLGHVSLVFVLSHIAGFILKDSPWYMAKIGADFGHPTEASVYFGLGLAAALTVVLPALIKKPCYQSMIILNIFALLELGTALLCVAMYNISLAMYCAVLYVPFALLICPIRCRACSFVHKTFWLLLHPFALASVTVVAYTFVTFPDESVKEILLRGVGAARQAVMFSIVDSMIYGNWLFSVACTIFVPNWLCFWYMSLYVPKPEELCPPKTESPPPPPPKEKED